MALIRKTLLRLLPFATGVLVVGILFGSFHFTKGVQPPFDSAYNFLVYKNAVDLGSFEYRYGTKHVPFDPVASTGPLINGPIAFFYWLASPGPESFYIATAIVHSLFLGVFLLFLIRCQGVGQSFFTIAILTSFVILNYFMISEGSFLTGLGEHYVVILGFAGFLMLANAKSAKSLYLAFGIIGLSLLIKINHAIGLILPLGIWGIAQLRTKSNHQLFRPSIKELAICGIILIFPYAFYKFALPFLALSKPSYENFLGHNRGFNSSIKGFAFRNYDLLREYLFQGNQNGLSEIANNLNDKWHQLQNFKGSVAAVYAYFLNMALAILTLGILRNQSSFFRGLFYFALFGLSIVLWWTLLNNSSWFRYLLIGDLAFTIIWALLSSALIGGILLGRNGYKKWPALIKASVTLVSLLALYSHLTFLGRFSYSDYFQQRRAEKEIDLRIARELNQAPANNLVWGWAWFQSPRVRDLTTSEFADITSQDDLKFYANTPKDLYYVMDPMSFVDPNATTIGDQLKSELMIEEKSGYRLYKLDREKFKKYVQEKTGTGS